MRVITTTLLCLMLAMPVANAQIQPQTMRPSETMPDPGANWFMSISDFGSAGGMGGYIYDASTGEMHGLISLGGQSPAVQPNPARHEFYAANSFYSRGSYGDRTDVLVIHDYANLKPIAEIEIPKKITVLSFREYIGLMSGGRHIGISNMTPAQSVSIVDIVDRKFVGEISTPGCALILPVDNNDFMTMCGDGTLMLVDLDDNGNEANRARSKKFFDVQVDPVYDRPQRTAGGWLLISHGGKAFDVTTSGSRITVSDPWEIVTDEDREAGWWPGGGQLATVHRTLGLLYISMHQGEQYSHHEPGTEVWVFSLASKRRIARIEFETPVDNIMVTQEAEPLLIVGDEKKTTQVYDALKFRHERTIVGPAGGLFEDL